MKKITPCLWFDNEAEAAAKHYISIFPNSKIKHIEKYTVDTPSNKKIGSVMTVSLNLDGNEFLLLNGGTFFKLSEAVSFIINCKDQKEIDYFYNKLSADPKSEVCGWIKDKFGVSWQLITKEFEKIMSTTSAEKNKEVMTALLQMKRINIDQLKSIAKA